VCASVKSYPTQNRIAFDSITSHFRFDAGLDYNRFVAEEPEGEEAKTERRSCTLAFLTIRRLERLAKLATHGTSVPKVMTNLIEAGIRTAINEGYIRLEDD
jgi:hypothetical protein